MPDCYATMYVQLHKYLEDKAVVDKSTLDYISQHFNKVHTKRNQFYSQTEIENDKITKSTMYGGRYENHIRLRNLEELSPTIFSLLKKSYHLL
jgi:hypothetical protein